tara:strand:+ start:1204 stop:2016 length:813 start_codon:yes stop_codon:yes gene_type:complete
MTTQLPTAGSSISLQQIRNFYKGSSGSISLSELYKGGSYVPNPASYNGSSLQTTLASNANSNVGTSGAALAFDDFYGGMKLVAPTCSAINPGSGTNYATLDGDWTRTGSPSQRPWVGQKNSSSNLYHSGWAINYSVISSSNIQNESQLFFLVNQAYDVGASGTFSKIQMNKTGQYRVNAAVSGGNSPAGSLTIGGAGVISGGLSSQTIAHGAGYYEFDIVFEANKNIEITTSGYGTNAFALYITTNCNAPADYSSSYYGANNYMLTTYQN